MNKISAGFCQIDNGKCTFSSKSFEGFCGDSSGLSLGAILGIAGGGLALLIIIIVISICCYKKRKIMDITKWYHDNYKNIQIFMRRLSYLQSEP